ncbi:unnamed protein product, partial [Coregonus sp. 'balchen']
MAKFHAPEIQDNPSGWGPCAVPEKFKDMPYQPFSKGDRLGKVADWTGATYQDKRYTNKYSSQFGGGSQYAYFHEEDETSFQLVDTAKTQKTAYQRNRMRFAQRNLRRDKDRRNLTQFNMQTLPKSAKQKERDRMRLQKKFQKQFGVRQKWDQKSQAQLKPRDSSVEVRSDWEVKEEMDFPRLMKMRYMECCGALEYYDKAFDRVTTRNEKPLKSIKRIFHTVTTTDDPVIRKLAKTQGNVFATDAILATLMCCTRSVNSWDIIVQRVGNKLFFDKRDNSDFDLLTVSETANEPPQDEGNSFNSPRNLAMEATYINHNFSQQCLRMGGERHKFPNPNPFVEEDIDKSEVASVAYRYRRWKLGEDIDLIVRCEHDGVMTGANGEVSFINVKTLNEWDSRHCNGVDWRQKLDSQRGAVLATELKNNSYKLARWTCCAMLAGSEYLKLGYVSRYHAKDSARHVVLGTQQFQPTEFASQINLSMENAWGILRCVIDICRKLEEGKYLILKDPNKQVIRVECCGALEYYDKAFDRVTTRNEKPLKSIKRIFHTVTTTDDPVIRKLAKTQGNVFATDAILATLMCCTRSVNSWDIIVQRVGNKLFFDKRDNSDFGEAFSNLLTVSETANEPPQDEGNSFNSPRNLAMEATYINHNFSQQCLRMGGERHKFPNPNPLYRRWKLGEDIDLIVRCEHDGVMTGANGEVSFINVKTLNEWDSRHCNGVDWRQKLDSQRGAVLATELKNNSYKLARWTCCAMLAGSEYLKLGYVSRYHAKDSARHVVLGTQQFQPTEFASQINLSMENAWGILRCVIDICRKLEEGKYLILKDPNKMNQNPK